MSKRARTIALCAMMTALSVICLWLSSILPTGQLGFSAAALLFGCAAVLEVGIGGGAAVYICSVLLGALLMSNRFPLFYYVVFFGYYPIVKSLAERAMRRYVEWIVKLAVFNAALAMTVMLFSEAVLSFSPVKSLPVICILANAVFVIFDIGLTRLIRFYMARIHKYRQYK